LSKETTIHLLNDQQPGNLARRAIFRRAKAGLSAIAWKAAAGTFDMGMIIAGYSRFKICPPLSL
jgi:hypothetical protein